VAPKRKWHYSPSHSITRKELSDTGDVTWTGALETPSNWRGVWKLRHFVIAKQVNASDVCEHDRLRWECKRGDCRGSGKITRQIVKSALPLSKPGHPPPSIWLFWFDDEKDTSRIGGCTGLFSFASLKIYTGDDDHNNLVLYPDPAVPELERITLRAPPEADTRIEWKSAQDLRQFAALALDIMRQENEVARKYKRAFNQEMFYECGVPGIPEELVDFVRDYMATKKHPNQGPHGTSDLLEYCHFRLLSLCLASRIDSRTEEHAKNLTAMCARTTRELFCYMSIPEAMDRHPYAQHAWRELEVLQEYQLRQLVEVVVFEVLPTKGIESMFFQLQEILQAKTRESQYEVVYKHGVALRYTPDFGDRIARGWRQVDGKWEQLSGKEARGPTCGTRVIGREVPGIDGVPFLATEDGYLPISLANGRTLLEKCSDSPLPEGYADLTPTGQLAVQLRGEVERGVTSEAEASRLLAQARETGVGPDGLPIGAGALFADLSRVSEEFDTVAGCSRSRSRSPPPVGMYDETFVTPSSSERGGGEGAGLSEEGLGEALTLRASSEARIRSGTVESVEEDFSSFKTPDGAWRAEQMDSVRVRALAGTPKGAGREGLRSPRQRQESTFSSLSRMSSMGGERKGRIARLEERIAAMEAKGAHNSGEWFDLLAEWAKGLDEVAARQALVNKQREALPQMTKDDWMHRLTLDEGWAQKLKKKLEKHYGTTPSIDHFAALLEPALEMVRAITLCTTPVQKLRLWTESVLEATRLIKSHGIDFGGDDMPSLVLFLIVNVESFDLVAQVQIAKLFLVDEVDYEELELNVEGYYHDLANQYVFDAERRCIDIGHNLLWIDSALDVLAELQGKDDKEEEDRIYMACESPTTPLEEEGSATEGEESQSPERVIRQYPFFADPEPQQATGGDGAVAAAAMGRYSAAEKYT